MELRIVGDCTLELNACNAALQDIRLEMEPLALESPATFTAAPWLPRLRHWQERKQRAEAGLQVLQRASQN